MLMVSLLATANVHEVLASLGLPCVRKLRTESWVSFLWGEIQAYITMSTRGRYEKHLYAKCNRLERPSRLGLDWFQGRSCLPLPAVGQAKAVRISRCRQDALGSRSYRAPEVTLMRWQPTLSAGSL